MYTSTILVYGRYVLSSVIQVALGFLLDFPVALEVVLLHLGQTQRAPLWLEVFEVWLAALSFIISFSSTNLHFLHTGLSQIFNSIDPHLHRADCNRCLIDGLNGSNDNLFFRHINLLWRWPNIFFMDWFIGVALCLIYLFISRSKDDCDFTYLLEILILSVLQVPTYVCFGLKVHEGLWSTLTRLIWEINLTIFFTV